MASRVPTAFDFDGAGYAAIMRISTDSPNGEPVSLCRLVRKPSKNGERVYVEFFGPERLRAREIRALLRDEKERLRFVDSKGARVEFTPITLEWWRAHGKHAAMSDFDPDGDTPTDLEKLRAYVAHGGVPS